jgi:putative transposase
MALDKSAIADLLDALPAGGDLDIIREGLAVVLQALIDAEATEVIGADRYQRTAGRTTHRNGSRARLLSTKAGDVELRIPKLREGSFFPALLEPRRRIDRALLAVVMEAYVHGTSTPKVDDLVKALGVEAGISKSEVSRICAELDGEVAAFRSRSLGHTAFPYVFVDATYLKARVAGRVVSRAVVIATGVTADGGREVLGLDVGDSEDGAFWTAFLRSLKARGLSGVQLVISDAHPASRPPSPRSWPAPAGNAAGSTSSETCWPESPKAQPRWWPRPSAPSSPSPAAPRSSTRSTRSPPCWLTSSLRSP